MRYTRWLLVRILSLHKPWYTARLTGRIADCLWFHGFKRAAHVFFKIEDWLYLHR